MTKAYQNNIHDESIELLKQLIATPSFSKLEESTALLIEGFLKQHGVIVKRHFNNVYAQNRHFNPAKPTLLLNSHHDTVKPNKGYTLDPFKPLEQSGKLFGLGSNDAGGALVSLIAAFLYFHEAPDLKYNLILAATAEEEISGINGIEALLPLLGPIDSAIVGEPTQMHLAVAERGLLVLDCLASGVAGHAARMEGENAIYKALTDIDWLRRYQFPKTSELLGGVKMSVTSIETTNKTHNIVPADCSFVVDVRVNECYTLSEVIDTIKSNLKSTIHPRSTRLQSTSISKTHPLVLSGLSLNLKTYGSPTTSDKALMPFPALKIGPGNSARSHTADEFIYLDEITQGIDLYIQLLKNIVL